MRPITDDPRFTRRQGSLAAVAFALAISMSVVACSTSSQAKEAPTSRARVAIEAATVTPTRVRPVLTYPTFPPPPGGQVPDAPGTPSPAAAAAAATKPGTGDSTLTWTSEVSSGRGTFKPGTTSTFAVSVLASQNIKALVDIEIFDPNGIRVLQTSTDNIDFTANANRTLDVTWPIKSNSMSGAYVVEIGVFAPGWGSMYHWNQKAFTYHVNQ